MSNKAYKVIKDTPTWNEGAILVLNQAGTSYYPVEDLWNKFEDEEYGSCKKIVENSPEYFERVYEMNKGKKAIYVSKEKAQEIASQFFEG